MTRKALTIKRVVVSLRVVDEDILYAHIGQQLGGNASEWEHIVHAAESLKTRAEQAEALLIEQQNRGSAAQK